MNRFVGFGVLVFMNALWCLTFASGASPYPLWADLFVMGLGLVVLGMQTMLCFSGPECDCPHLAGCEDDHAPVGEDAKWQEVLREAERRHGDEYGLGRMR